MLIVSGPSGVGKGTVNGMLLADEEHWVLSISVTTRSRRPTEIDGREYYFISREEFLRHRDNGDFLEWAEVFGDYYGTLRIPVEESLDLGFNVLLEIDVQGALQVKENWPDALYVFLAPPSMEELERRLRNRGTEREEQIQRRLKTAEWEMTMRHHFDHIIVNDDVTEAFTELKDIVERYIGEKNNAN